MKEMTIYRRRVSSRLLVLISLQKTTSIPIGPLSPLITTSISLQLQVACMTPWFANIGPFKGSLLLSCKNVKLDKEKVPSDLSLLAQSWREEYKMEIEEKKHEKLDLIKRRQQIFATLFVTMRVSKLVAFIFFVLFN